MNHPPKENLVACIDEMECIGCVKCIHACPEDAILGASGQIHAVLPELCTGCGLCLAPCPVVCIRLAIPDPTPGKQQVLLGTPARDCQGIRERHRARQHRLQDRDKSGAQQNRTPASTQTDTEKRAYVEEAVSRSRARRERLQNKQKPPAASAGD